MPPFAQIIWERSCGHQLPASEAELSSMCPPLLPIPFSSSSRRFRVTVQRVWGNGGRRAGGPVRHPDQVQLPDGGGGGGRGAFRSFHHPCRQRRGDARWRSIRPCVSCLTPSLPRDCGVGLELEWQKSGQNVAERGRMWHNVSESGKVWQNDAH